MIGCSDGDSGEDELVSTTLCQHCERLRRLFGGLASLLDRHRPCVCVGETDSREKLEAAAERVLLGWAFSQFDHVECAECGRSLWDGGASLVRARRWLATLVWYVEAVACDGCERSLTAQHACLDILAAARVTVRQRSSTRSDRFVLTDVSITAAVGNQPSGETSHTGEVP